MVVSVTDDNVIKVSTFIPENYHDDLKTLEKHLSECPTLGDFQNIEISYNTGICNDLYEPIPDILEGAYTKINIAYMIYSIKRRAKKFLHFDEKKYLSQIISTIYGHLDHVDEFAYTSVDELKTAVFNDRDLQKEYDVYNRLFLDAFDEWIKSFVIVELKRDGTSIKCIQGYYLH